MLEAFAAGDVGEGEEEVVDVVVVRVVGGAGFADQVGDFVEELGAEVGVVGLVGDYVDVVLGGDLGSEGELVEVLAGDDGRVLQLLDGGGLILRGAAYFCVGVVGAGGGEGGADAPAGGDGDAGLDGDVADGDVGGIEEELLPLEDGDLVVGARGDDAVEVGVEGGDAGGNVDVELVEILVVAAPG